MLIYMLLNLIEERAYVGSTTDTVESRIKGHWDCARSNYPAPLYQAMRRWDNQEWWTYVVLQHCYEQDKLDDLETSWIAYCCSADTAVGYNQHRTAHAAASRNQPKPAPMSEERREFFRECGRRGAVHGKKGARKKEDMSEEEREKFREWGRKGAAKSKKLAT